MEKEKTKKVAIVTGGSSGIGYAICNQLHSCGYVVYEFSRKLDSLENVATHITCDVTDESAVITAVNNVYKSENQIDLLINNAGYGISGAVEFTDLADAKRQFDVNFFGTFAVTKAVIPYMRAQGGGCIINVSSVAALIPIPYQSFYSAAKSSINALTLALRNELSLFNISVCAICPGDIRTNFTSARAKNVIGDQQYNGKISKAVAVMEKDEQNGMNPQVIARKVASIAKITNVKPFYTCGVKYKLFLFLEKILPKRFTNWLVGKIY